jgi:ABC-type Zn uptake system ZnuABC Zn-binding protein ZnuA
LTVIRRYLWLRVLLLPTFLLFVAVRPMLAAVTVVATTQDLKSLTAVIGGTAVHVDSLVPPGADGETYEPRPGDLLRLRGASLVVRIGLGYDDWLDPLLAEYGDARLMPGGSRHVDASAGIPLLEVQSRSVEVRSGRHAHGMANPHYWLDPGNAQTITASIANGLSQIAPDQASEFAANRQHFLAMLADRIAGWETRLAPYAGTAVVAYHNSWPYFARRFRLRIVAIIEPKEGVPPSPIQLARIAGEMRAANAKVVLMEPQEPREGADAVARRSGAQVALVAGSIGQLPGADDYFSIFETDIVAILQCLNRNGP